MENTAMEINLTQLQNLIDDEFEKAKSGRKYNV